MMQTLENAIQWRLHLNSPPEQVYAMLATDAGRAQFWAEATRQSGETIQFLFPDGATWEGPILEARPGELLRIRYYGGSETTFELAADGLGGTELLLTDRGVSTAYQAEVMAGWVSVLMALKAAVDFGVDLRNHDPRRTWASGYADN